MPVLGWVFVAVAVVVVGLTLWALIDQAVRYIKEASSAEEGEKTTKRRSKKQVTDEWERIHGREWPKGEDGKPLEADHDIPLADGGSDSGDNVTPRTKADHIRRHIENGDFSMMGEEAMGANSWRWTYTRWNQR